MNATQGSKVHLHQTEPPNALPASWRCPGQPRVLWEVFSLRNIQFTFGHGGNHPGYVGAKGGPVRPVHNTELNWWQAAF